MVLGLRATLPWSAHYFPWAAVWEEGVNGTGPNRGGEGR